MASRKGSGRRRDGRLAAGAARTQLVAIAYKCRYFPDFGCAQHGAAAVRGLVAALLQCCCDVTVVVRSKRVKRTQREAWLLCMPALPHACWRVRTLEPNARSAPSPTL